MNDTQTASDDDNNGIAQMSCDRTCADDPTLVERCAYIQWWTADSLAWSVYLFKCVLVLNQFVLWSLTRVDCKRAKPKLRQINESVFIIDSFNTWERKYVWGKNAVVLMWNDEIILIFNRTDIVRHKLSRLNATNERYIFSDL